MKRIKRFSMLLATVLSISVMSNAFVCTRAVDSSKTLQDSSNSNYSNLDITLDDLDAIECFIHNKKYIGYGKVIDVDDDGSVDVFDLGLAKKYVTERIAQDKSDNGIIDLQAGKVTNTTDAFHYIDSISPDIAINSPSNSLFKLECINEQNNNKYYLMRQKYDGIDVYGGSIVLVVNDQGMCNTIIDSFIPGIKVDTLHDQGKDAAIKSIESLDRYSKINSIVFNDKVIYPYNGSYYFTYQFVVNGLLSQNENFTEELVFVNANNGEIVNILPQFFEDSVSQSSATLKDTAGNPLKYNIWRNDTSNKLELYDSSNGIEIFDIDNNKLSYSFVDIEGKDISGENASAVYNIRLTSKVFGDPKVIDNSNKNYDRAKTIMEYAEKTYNYYYNLGKIGMRSSKINHVANIKDGVIIVLNDNGVDNGCTRGLPLCSNLALISFSKNYTENMQLDVIAHEYTHAVLFSENKLNLGPSSLDLALQEAYADIMGEVIERDKSWIHGKGLSERSAVEQRAYKDTKWIDSDSESASHINSNVVFHCAYLMYDHLIKDYGYTSDKAFDEIGRLWYNSIFYLKEYNNGFRDCLNAVYQSAKQLNYSDAKINTITKCFSECNIIDDQTVTFNANDESGKTLSNCVFIIDGIKRRIGANGTCSCSLRAGSHYVTVSKSDYGKASKYFTVDYNNTEVNLTVLCEEQYKDEEFSADQKDVDFLKTPLDITNANIYCDNKNYEMNGRIYQQGIYFYGAGSNPDYTKEAEIIYNVESINSIVGTWGHVDNTHMKDATVSIYLDNTLVDTINLTPEMELKPYSINTSKAASLKIHLDLKGGSAYGFGDISINGKVPATPHIVPNYDSPEEFIADGYNPYCLTVFNNEKTFEMDGRIYQQGIKFFGGGDNPDYNKEAEITFNVENINSIVGTWGHVDNTHMKDATVSIYLDNTLVDTINLTPEMKWKQYSINTSKASRLKIYLELKGGSAYGFGDISIK